MNPATVREVALTLTSRAADDLARAARHVQASVRMLSPGGHARHAVEIVAHCAADCMFNASVISGAPLPYRTEEEREQAVTGCDSLEKACEFLRAAVDQVCEAIGELTDARTRETMVMPWGERVPVAFGILSPAIHLQYHIGQVNQIQTIMGDDEDH